MNRTIAAEIALSLVVVALSAALLRDAWRAWRPARLLLAGRYSDASVAANELARSWMRVFTTVRFSARYWIACSLHLRGDLEGSLSALAAIDARDVRVGMRYAVCSLEAANLVLLGRDHARASKLIDEARQIQRLPEDLLLAAHARHALGDSASAGRLFTAAGTTRGGGPARSGGVALFEDRRQQEVIFHTLRALFLSKVGRAAEAQVDLDIASKSPITNVYVERARELLETRATDTDGTSSLAPQVVANDVANET